MDSSQRSSGVYRNTREGSDWLCMVMWSSPNQAHGPTDRVLWLTGPVSGALPVGGHGSMRSPWNRCYTGKRLLPVEGAKGLWSKDGMLSRQTSYTHYKNFPL